MSPGSAGEHCPLVPGTPHSGAVLAASTSDVEPGTAWRGWRERKRCIRLMPPPHRGQALPWPGLQATVWPVGIWVAWFETQNTRSDRQEQFRSKRPHQRDAAFRNLLEGLSLPYVGLFPHPT